MGAANGRMMMQVHGDSYPKLREVLGEAAFAELAQLIRRTYEANEERRRRSGGESRETLPAGTKPSGLGPAEE